MALSQSCVKSTGVKHLMFKNILEIRLTVSNLARAMAVSGQIHDSIITWPSGMQNIKGPVQGPEKNNQNEEEKRTSVT